jgi:glycosyltransferase involved in cell wall biosynthesis
LRILLVSTADLGGGAEISAWNLFKAFRRHGHKSWLAVGNKRSDDPDVFSIPKDSCRSSWAQFWIRAANKLGRFESDVRGATRLRNLFQLIGEPRRWLENRRGYEDFNFPGSWRLLELTESPDIVHCYNLHEGYFDLRLLPWLSHQRPVILDLRDAWLLSGHCAHSFDCDRWKTGCGKCPDLTIYPAIQRDATAYNWQRKKEIYSRSRLYVATPSKWLMQKVAQSMLAPAIAESKVIPTGVDLSLFRPANKQFARAALKLPQEARIVLFVGNRIERSIWKDHNMMRAAFSLTAERSRERKLLFVGLGGDAHVERFGNAELRFIPYQQDWETVARHYQACDLYVHAARADTFPRAVLEALACGTPVVATEVGGIPEQIKGLRGAISASVGSNRYGANHATGALVPTGDAEAIAESVRSLLSNDSLRQQMSENASKDARERFDIEQQAERYLQWYAEIAGKVVSREDHLTAAL